MQVEVGGGEGGEIVSIEVEVIDRTLNYNLMLGHTWVYAMAIVI